MNQRPGGSLANLRSRCLSLKGPGSTNRFGRVHMDSERWNLVLSSIGLKDELLNPPVDSGMRNKLTFRNETTKISDTVERTVAEN